LPFSVDDIKFLSSDFVEFLAVFVTMAIAFGIMIVLGRWWSQ